MPAQIRKLTTPPTPQKKNTIMNYLSTTLNSNECLLGNIISRLVPTNIVIFAVLVSAFVSFPQVHYGNIRTSSVREILTVFYVNFLMNHNPLFND